MIARIGTGLAQTDAGVDSFAEAAARAALELGGAPADLVVVFAGAANLDHSEAGLAAVAERLRPKALIGCGAQGVVGSGREVEMGGISVWAASLPGAAVESFHAEVMAGDETTTGPSRAMAVVGIPELDDSDGMVLIADPYTFPVEPVLRRLTEQSPGLPVVGGLASAQGRDGLGFLFHDGALVRSGAVGVALEGVELRACVSQGARPVGPEMTITAAEDNVIHELASKPALERLREAIGELEESERALAAEGLLIGIVIDENQPDYERGDFLVRGVLGADPGDGSVTVGERVRTGQTVRLHVRDGSSAGHDLRAAVAEGLAASNGPPAGALLFTCNGRGSHMFDEPDHDARTLDEALGGAPVAGFFCAGEIGPVGGRNFVHGFTATLAVFGALGSAR